MVAENSKSSTTAEEMIDILKSTQTVIHHALEKLGYPNEVFELIKRTLTNVNG